VADSRKILAVRGGDVEHWYPFEASDHLLLFVSLLVSLLVDHGGENPDGLLSLADKPYVRLPGIEPGDPGGFVSLLGDEHDVVRAVAIEAALAGEVALPLVGCGEVGDSLEQLFEEFGTVGCGGHFVGLLVGPDATHPKSRDDGRAK